MKQLHNNLCYEDEIQYREFSKISEMKTLQPLYVIALYTSNTRICYSKHLQSLIKVHVVGDVYT